MKKLHISYILVTILMSLNLQAKSLIKLAQGEKLFRSMKSYRLQDFNFNWKISYMDIVNYDVAVGDKSDLELLPKMKFHTVAKMGKTVKFSHRKQLWLVNALLKEEYFWKQMLMPPGSMYAFSMLRFLEEGDKRFKAVSELKDINDMFGSIDTEAELRLWLLAMKEYRPYSYKKVGKLYRVRFSISSLGCYYTEYFKYYNKNGKVVKEKKLKEHRIENCDVIMR